jgi:hypothetical protein
MSAPPGRPDRTDKRLMSIPVPTEIDQDIALDWLSYSLGLGEVQVISLIARELIAEHEGHAYVLVPEGVDAARLAQPRHRSIQRLGHTAITQRSHSRASRLFGLGAVRRAVLSRRRSAAGQRDCEGRRASGGRAGRRRKPQSGELARRPLGVQCRGRSESRPSGRLAHSGRRPRL